MSRPVAIARKTAAFRLLALLALSAFIVQGILVQTHIHGKPVASPQAVSQMSAPGKADGQEPLAPVTCSLCQEIARGAVFVAPVLSGLPVPLAWAALRPAPDGHSLTGDEQTFNWQSRAPPRA